MQILGFATFIRDFTRSSACHPGSRPDGRGLETFFAAFHRREAGEALHGAWSCLLDRLRGVHELGRGQSLGPARVDAAGGMDVRGLRLENGQIRLPNGRSVPIGNTGAIIRLPDGTQVAIGRQGDQAVRWVVAGEGEDIPTSPPGATNLFELDCCGALRPAGVK